MNLFKFLFRCSKGSLAVAVLVGIVSGIGSAALMALINKRLSTADRSVPELAATFAVLVLIVLVSNLASRLLLNRLAESAAYELRLHLCRQVLDAPLRHLEETGAHKILAALTQDINTITGALLAMPVVCINLTIVVGCMIYLGWLSMSVLAGLVAFLLVALWSIQLIQRRGQRSLKLAREEWDKLVEHFRALTEGTKELKLHRGRREAFLRDFLQATALAYRRHDNEGKKVYAAGSSWTHVLYFLFIGMILFALPDLQHVSLATLSGFTVTALYIRAPINILLDAHPIFKRATISLEKVEELGLTFSNFAAEGAAAAELSAGPWGRIDLAGVTHEFYHERDDRRFALGPVDLTIYPGEIVFVVGGNGSGKTTFAKLLTGLYSPAGGEISVDGVAITDENRDAYRQMFSVIFSDFYLFDQLVGLEGPALDARAREYLAKLHLDRKVFVENGKLSTVDLSRGQRKRLALLTAYLEDRPLYVLDEWAADQDHVFRDIFYLELLPELKARGKTVIAITHDDRYYHLADRLIKFDEGKLEYDKMMTPNPRQEVLELPGVL